MKPDNKPMMKEPWMWLVLGLPASVVIAGFATLWIAASDPQTIAAEPHSKLGFTVQQVQPPQAEQQVQ